MGWRLEFDGKVDVQRNFQGLEVFRPGTSNPWKFSTGRE